LAKRTSPIRPPLWTPSSGFAIGLNRPAGWSERRKRSCTRNRSLRGSKSRLRSRPRVQSSSTSLFAILHSPTVLGPIPIFPPFFPVFAGAAIGGCGWISGPIIVPFVLNFRTRHIEIDRKRLALFDRDRDREGDSDHALGEEWSHDPGHRGNVPYRDAAVSALFGSGAPAANFNPAFRGPLKAPSPVERPLAASLPQKWQRPGMEGARLPLNGGRPWLEGIRAPLEEGRSSTTGVQPRLGGVHPALEGVDPTLGALVGASSQPFGDRGPGAIGARPFSGPWFGGVQPALEGVDPTESRTPDGQLPDRDAEKRMLIERESFGRVSPNALAPPLGGLRASPSFGIASTQSLGDRRSSRPLVGIGAQPSGARGPGAIGARPFSGKGPQTPSGVTGAGSGRGGG
jgi:hypothetical protein